jgi:two-component system alkaline phosphatase synthesis response regulator PhoP
MEEKMTNLHVVVVEDDIQSLEIVNDTLIKNGYKVDSFTDGLESYKFILNNAGNINVIILAKTLPNIAGMEMLTKIQNNDRLKDIPVIIITVDSIEGHYQDAIKMGAQFYVNKPIDPKKILRLVKAAGRFRLAVADNDSFVNKILRHRSDLES